MLIAQQSTILAQLIRKDNIITFEKMEDVGTVEQKVDCVRYLYGADLEFDLQNIETAVKFGSFYGINDLFEKSIQWIRSNLTIRNILKIHKVLSGFEDEKHEFQVRGVIRKFISSNTDLIAKEFVECLGDGCEIDHSLILAVLSLSPTDGAQLLKTWISKCDENKTHILENSSKLDFVKLFPTQESFTKLVTEILAGPSCVDTMKQVVALQQEYFTKSIAMAAAKQQEAEQPVPLNAVLVIEFETNAVSEDHVTSTGQTIGLDFEKKAGKDDAESTTSSTHTTSSKRKNRCRRQLTQKEPPLSTLTPALLRQAMAIDAAPEAVPTEVQCISSVLALQSGRSMLCEVTTDKVEYEYSSSTEDERDSDNDVSDIEIISTDSTKADYRRKSNNPGNYYAVKGQKTQLTKKKGGKFQYLKRDNVHKKKTGATRSRSNKSRVQHSNPKLNSPTDAAENRMLFVSSLPLNITVQEISGLFLMYGQITKIDLKIEHRFAFLEFESHHSVETVLCGLSEIKFLIRNQVISVKKCPKGIYLR